MQHEHIWLSFILSVGVPVFTVILSVLSRFQRGFTWVRGDVVQIQCGRFWVIGLISWSAWPRVPQQNFYELAGSRESQFPVEADVQFSGYSECHSH